MTPVCPQAPTTTSAHPGTPGQARWDKSLISPGTAPASDPSCRERQRHEGRHAGELAGGAGSAQILLQTEGEQRQPLLGVAVPHRQVPPGLPSPAIHEHRHIGIRFVTPSQRRSPCDQPPPCPRLRAGPSTSSTPLEPLHPRLASTGGGVDQSAATRKRRHCGFVGDGCLIGGRGVIFPGSHRPGGDPAPQYRYGRGPDDAWPPVGLTLHADSGGFICSATLAVQEEELGVLSSFSSPRVSNHHHYSEATYRTVKYRHDYPSYPVVSQDRPSNGQRHSWPGTSISTATARTGSSPRSSTTAKAPAICQHPTQVYKQACQAISVASYEAFAVGANKSLPGSTNRRIPP